MYKLSPHASRERLERMMFLNMNIGIGKEICSIPSLRGDRTEILTDTGLILVLTNNNLMITAYVATMPKATVIWRTKHGNKKMPNCLYETILQNKRVYERVKEIDDIFGYHENNKSYKYF